MVELDVQALLGPVNAHINHKLSEMGHNSEYSKEVLEEMSVEIRQRAENTFL